MAPGQSTGRRAFLAAATGTAAATAGCVRELRNLVGRQRARQLSLTVAHPPAADDPYAVRIANRLADNLARSGIDTVLDPMADDVLRREILVNHDFDIYVARYPGEGDPDQLRSLLYSTYAEEAGWQNPVGFSDLAMDEILDRQRTETGDERVETVREIQRRVVDEQPFTVVAYPDRIAGVRAERYTDWPDGGLTLPTDYLTLRRLADVDTVELLLRDDRATHNRNPISAEHRNQGDIIGLLYDPLVRQTRNGSVPWLARNIDWTEHDGTLVAAADLRSATWHDGPPVGPDDVAFTYRFLGDTSLDTFETPVPTPWRRGCVSLIDHIETDAPESELRIQFETSNRALARRALTVPVLPEHIWESRSDAADLAGIDIVGGTTEALVTANEAAVGSGPLELAAATVDESLELAVFDDHFLYGDDVDGIPDRFAGQPPFERLRFTVAPSHDAAVELLSAGSADATADGLQADVVSRVQRDESLSLRIARSDQFYHIGYNCRRAPTSDPHFRRAVARHIDRTDIVAESMGGYADPSEVPFTGEWVPNDLRWDGQASLSFFGEDGELNAEAAREAFQDAGYQYDDGQLVRRS